MIRRYVPKSAADLVRWYERYISPLALIAGFFADNLILLRRVDLWRSNILLLSYLVIAALGILLINIIHEGKWKQSWVLKIAPFIPVIVQFSFGGLFSGYLSLYARSAGFLGSWVFVFIVAAFLIGNERFTRLYVRFSFQIGLYFTVLFSFFIFFLPVVFHRIGPWMFLLSGAASLAVITGFLIILHRAVPDLEKANRMKIASTIAIIFLIFNALYFTNFIPPLPLALKESGVYHSAVRLDGQYHFFEEPQPWYRSILPYNTKVHLLESDNAYVYTAIFAPTDLKTNIVHQWQRYNDVRTAWETLSTVQFPVVGGRDGGYRGYSAKSALQPGKWRVNVLTLYGQMIGRVTFTVTNATSTDPLVEIVK